MESLALQIWKFVSAHVSLCSDSSVTLWLQGDSESSLLDVVETGFRIGLPPRVHSPRHHLRVHHRIAVFDILPGEQTPDGPIPEWRITSVVSQMDILRFLAANMASLVDQEEEANARADKFGCAGTVASMHASLQELGLVHGAAAVVTVTAFTPTLVVLATVHKAKLSGVGIVASNDQNAPLLATLSASDVRGLTPDRFGALSLPVGAFLLLMHPESTPPGGPRSNKVTWEDALLGQFPPPVAEGRWEDALAGLRSQTVRCAPEASLREAVELMVRGGKHRVYVCDATGRAVGVVTPTDVLRLVVE